MHSFTRYFLPILFAGVFLALATVALDKPGYYYDEVIFVPVSLRVLGECEVDAAVTSQVGCYPLMQTLGYVGAVKAWLHAPIFAAFGINLWTVRLPSILIGLVTLLFAWSFVRHELGAIWAALLLALLATDPVFLNHARLDWGPQMIAACMRVLSLAALWRWLQTGRMHWLAILCAAFLTGFVDKLNFIWVIGAFSAAAVVAAGRHVLDRLRSGRPWQPLLAGVTAALLIWGVVTLVRRAAQLDPHGDAAAMTWSAHLLKVWNLYAGTFSGMSVIGMVFGAGVPETQGFNILLLLQLAAAIAMLALWRPWTPARRLLAYLTAATVFLLLAIVATPQVAGSHHLVMLWPLPTVHLVTLLAIAAQHAGGTHRERGMALRASVATGAAVAWGVLLAWHIAMDYLYVDIWRNDHNFQPRYDPAIAELSRRVDALGVDRVISVDWGLHQPLVTLDGRHRPADFREWSWRLIDAPDLERPDLRQAVAEHLKGKRVAFVLYSPNYTAFAGAHERLNALLAHDRPCAVTREAPVRVAGKPLYEIVVADYKSCASPAKGG